MKGKVSFYVNVPNLSKVRSRIEKPSKEFTSKMRAAVQKAIVDTVNENTLGIRAKLISAFATIGETSKDAKAAAQISGVLNPYFDVIASETPFAADADDETEDDAMPENEQPKAKFDDEFTD